MATTTSNNGTRPKLELQLNQPVRLKLLKPTPYTGENNHGKYYLYTVADEDGIEMAYFATESVHTLIQANQLKAGAMMQLTKRTKGIEFAIVGQSMPETSGVTLPDSSGDGLKEILLQCVKDAVEIVREAGIPMDSEALQKLATTLFITRSKNAA